jgi:hypothetical protein
MSLYRQPGRARPALIAGVVGVTLVIGLAIGFAIGRGTSPDPSAEDVVAQLRTQLQPLGTGLKLLPTEYPQAYAGAGNETAGVRGNAERMQATLRAAAPDLRVLDPAGARALEQRVQALAAAVAAKAPPAEVQRLTTEASDALAQVPGG